MHATQQAWCKRASALPSASLPWPRHGALSHWRGAHVSTKGLWLPGRGAWPQPYLICQGSAAVQNGGFQQPQPGCCSITVPWYTIQTASDSASDAAGRAKSWVAGPFRLRGAAIATPSGHVHRGVGEDGRVEGRHIFQAFS